jgi:hypothetical protein
MENTKKPKKIITMLVVFALLALISAGVGYFLRHSSSSAKVIDALNNNSRIASFLGQPVTRGEITRENIQFSNAGPSTQNVVTMDFAGKKHISVSATLFEQKQGTAIVALSVKANGIEQEFINMTLRTNVLTHDELLSKNNLSNFAEIVDKVQKNAGYLIITRSKKNNDYMQVGSTQKDGKPCLFLEYSQGFTAENKQIYRVDGGCLSKDAVLKMLYSYATGTDHFKKEAKWNPLKKIETDAQGNEQFIY